MVKKIQKSDSRSLIFIHVYMYMIIITDVN